MQTTLGLLCRALTRPSVIKSAGVIIQPLKYSKAVAQEKEEVLKRNQHSRQTIQRVSGGLNQPTKLQNKKQHSKKHRA